MDLSVSKHGCNYILKVCIFIHSFTQCLYYLRVCKKIYNCNPWHTYMFRIWGEIKCFATKKKRNNESRFTWKPVDQWKLTSAELSGILLGHKNKYKKKTQTKPTTTTTLYLGFHLRLWTCRIANLICWFLPFSLWRFDSGMMEISEN